MSIVSRILAENPDSFYVYSGASPYVDLSRRRLANHTPLSPVRVAVSPARGILESVTQIGQTAFTIHQAPAAGYTLMTQAKPLGTTNNYLSFLTTYNEGLWTVNSTLYFGVKHLDGTYTIVSTDIDISRMHIFAGTASSEQITLYLDGQPVASKQITSTSPITTDNSILFGNSQSMQVSFSATWNRPISGAAISAIQVAARQASLKTYALSQLFASDLRLDSASSDTEYFYFSENSPHLSDLATVDGTSVSASYDSSLVSVAGNVRFPVPFTSTTNGIRLSWGSSSGAVVKYSLDGTTFTTVYNGQAVEAGTTITNQPVIEVSFPAGSTSVMYLNDFAAERQITSALLPSLSNGRAVTTSGSVSLAADSDFRKYPSLPSTFGTNGTITIAPETEDVSILTYGIEFWFTPTASDLVGTKTLLNSGPEDAKTITLVSGVVNSSGFTNLFINKASVLSNTTSVVAGVPVHIVVKHAAANNLQIRIGSATAPVQGNLASVALIFQDFSTPEVTALYNNQQDVPVTRPTSNSAISVVDTGVSNLGLVWSAGSQ